MTSNNNPLSGLGPLLEGLGKIVGPVLRDALNARTGKAPPAELTEIAAIVSTMLAALAAKPTTGDWHARRTPTAQGVTHQVFAGDKEVAGAGMTEVDANYLAAVNPQALTKLLSWHAVREESAADVAKFEVSGDTLKKVHTGDHLSDDEVIGLVLHFRKLYPLLSKLGAPWTLASDAALRELNRAEDLLRARKLNA